MRSVLRLAFSLCFLAIEAWVYKPDGCGDLRNVSVPAGTTKIGPKAFFSCTRLVAVTIPDSVREIGEAAFQECTSLVSVSIPEGVTTIWDSSFAKCTSLRAIDLPESLRYLGEGSFRESGLVAVKIPNSIRQITAYSFHGCKSLSDVTIPEGVTAIRSEAFSYCPSLRDVQLPNSLRDLGDMGAFKATGLRAIDIPSGITRIPDKTFEDCEFLRQIFIPESVASIGDMAFSNCLQLADVRFPSKLTSIGERAFQHCRSLGGMSVPGSVTSIGLGAFDRTGMSVELPAHFTKLAIFVDDSCHLYSGSDGSRFHRNGKVQMHAESAFQICEKCNESFLQNVASVCIPLCAFAALVLVSFLAVRESVVTHMANEKLAAVIAMALNSHAMVTLQALAAMTLGMQQPLFLSFLLECLKLLDLDLRLGCLWREDADSGLGVLCGGLLALALALAILWQVAGPENLWQRAENTAASFLAACHWFYIGLSILMLHFSWPHAFTLDVNAYPADVTKAGVGIICLVVIYLLGVPVIVIYMAGRPSMSFATSAYKEDCRRRWLCIDYGVKVAFVALNSPGLYSVMGELKAYTVLVVVAVHAALTAAFRPFKNEVMLARNGKLFYIVLAGETIKVNFAAATCKATQSLSTWFVEVLLSLALILWLLLAAAVMLEPIGKWQRSLRDCKPWGSMKVYAEPADQVAPWHPSSPEGLEDKEEESEGEEEAPEVLDLGTFRPRAKHAVISAPGSALRSWNVLEKRCGKEPVFAQLVRPQGVDTAPILKKDKTFEIMINNGQRKRVKGKHLRYAGDTEYEFWARVAEYLPSWSFACVWMNKISGCGERARSFYEWRRSAGRGGFSSSFCSAVDISAESWDRFQKHREDICRKLEDVYTGSKCKGPPCENCGWFDHWAVNVLRCVEAEQKLYFAYLPEPVVDDQTVFQWSHEGKVTEYCVGKAQGVELWWAQDIMGMTVWPISAQELRKFAEARGAPH